MRALVFIVENIKRLIIVILLMGFINIVISYLITQNFIDYVDYHLPDNLLLTYYSDFEKEHATREIADYNMYQAEDVTSNVRGLDLNNIGFINDNSSSMKSYIQNKLNNGTTAIKQNVGYMYDSELFNEYKINIPLNTLDLDHVVIGQYPIDSQILISEEFATEIITGNEEINDYQDLLMFNYQGYQISGIYSSMHQTFSDEIIMYSDDTVEDQITVVLDYDKELLKLLEENDYSYVISEDYSSFNYKFFIQCLVVVTSFIFVFILMRKELLNFKYICKNNNVSMSLFIINILVPFLFIAAIILLVNI
ncbi:hypothetical protein R2F61_00805 [Mollicutes bacterium LVI A0078]|nr:hypothetical protein RZE84_00810 [Mollicutes bacterium LVI A0075]WOO91121.1 hypothetical protein R2F61_00805 [Mollicutes bacterium LVI A0078]